MKKLFYISAILVIISALVGMILPSNRNIRDFAYLLIMLLTSVSVLSGVSYIIKKLDKA